MGKDKTIKFSTGDRVKTTWNAYGIVTYNTNGCFPGQTTFMDSGGVLRVFVSSDCMPGHPSWISEEYLIHVPESESPRPKEAACYEC